MVAGLPKYRCCVKWRSRPCFATPAARGTPLSLSLFFVFATACTAPFDEPLECGDGTIEIEDECVTDTGTGAHGTGDQQDLSVTADVDGCEDFDFSDPEPSKLEGEYRGGGVVRVRRTFVVLNSSALAFDPEVDVDDPNVVITERWSGENEGASFCTEPLIDIGGVISAVTVTWYLEGEDSPFDEIRVEAGG